MSHFRAHKVPAHVLTVLLPLPLTPITLRQVKLMLSVNADDDLTHKTTTSSSFNFEIVEGDQL